mgnify:FL=1
MYPSKNYNYNSNSLIDYEEGAGAVLTPNKTFIFKNIYTIRTNSSGSVLNDLIDIDGILSKTILSDYRLVLKLDSFNRTIQDGELKNTPYTSSNLTSLSFSPPPRATLLIPHTDLALFDNTLIILFSLSVEAWPETDEEIFQMSGVDYEPIKIKLSGNKTIEFSCLEKVVCLQNPDKPVQILGVSISNLFSLAPELCVIFNESIVGVKKLGSFANQIGFVTPIQLVANESRWTLKNLMIFSGKDLIFSKLKDACEFERFRYLQSAEAKISKNTFEKTFATPDGHSYPILLGSLEFQKTNNSLATSQEFCPNFFEFEMDFDNSQEFSTLVSLWFGDNFELVLTKTNANINVFKNENLIYTFENLGAATYTLVIYFFENLLKLSLNDTSQSTIIGVTQSSFFNFNIADLNFLKRLRLSL